MRTTVDKRIKDLAKKQGQDLAVESAKTFADWLSKRPRMQGLPKLAKLLWVLGGRR